MKASACYLPIQSENGQALLIIVLLMVVGLTVGLSVASRNVINLKLSSEEVNSQKALNAAEAGIEQALNNTNPNSINGQKLGTASIANVAIIPAQSNSFLINGGNLISKDDGIDVWLTPFNSDPTKLYLPPFWSGNVTVYWGANTDTCSANASNTMAALEMIVISGPKTAPSISRVTAEHCALRKGYNNFDNAPANPGKTFPGSNGTVTPAWMSKTWHISNGLIMRIIPFYANAVIAVNAVPDNGIPNLPPQGQTVTSTGLAGATQRKITYYEANDSVPSEFFYSIFSPN